MEWLDGGSLLDHVQQQAAHLCALRCLRHGRCRGIVTSDVLVKGVSCGAIATRKLEGVNRDKGHERVYTSSAPYGEGKAYV